MCLHDKRRGLVVVVAMLAASCGGGVVPPSPETPPDEAMEAFVTSGGLPGLAVAVIKDRELVYSKVAGVRRRGDVMPVAADDAFHIGSNTKGSGIPEIGGEAELAFDRSMAPTAQQRREIAAATLALNPLWAAGTRFFYSNVNFVVAGLMLESVTGQSWEAMVTERLFGPLGMTRAGFGLPGTADQVDAPWGNSDGTRATDVAANPREVRPNRRRDALLELSNRDAGAGRGSDRLRIASDPRAPDAPKHGRIYDETPERLDERHVHRRQPARWLHVHGPIQPISARTFAQRRA
jgi:CubicO group peptidase (beta-lactamase class C family)